MEERKSNRLAKKQQQAKSSITQEMTDIDDILTEVNKLRCEVSELKQSLKEEIKAEFSQVRSDVIDTILKENAALKEKLGVSDSIIENLQKKLKKQDEELSDLKDSLYESEVNHDKLEQYTRRNNLEIAGISDRISDENLEEHVIDLLKDVGVTVSSRDIEACHRLPKSSSSKAKNLPKRSIVRFVNRKNVEGALRKRKLLKNNHKHNGIYFNENLCTNYREIWFKCRDIHRCNRIFSYHTYNGTVYYRLSENSKPTRIDHITDLDIFDEVEVVNISDPADWGRDD